MEKFCVYSGHICILIFQIFYIEFVYSGFDLVWFALQRFNTLLQSTMEYSNSMRLSFSHQNRYWSVAINSFGFFFLIHFPFHVSIFSLEFLYKYADIANKNRIQRMFCVEIKIILDSVTQFFAIGKNRLKRILLNGDIAFKKKENHMLKNVNWIIFAFLYLSFDVRMEKDRFLVKNL